MVYFFMTSQAFFNTAHQKTKTQGKNSRKKLKPKAQGKNSTSERIFPPFRKTHEKKLIFLSKLKICEGVGLFTAFLLTYIFEF